MYFKSIIVLILSACLTKADDVKSLPEFQPANVPVVSSQVSNTNKIR